MADLRPSPGSTRQCPRTRAAPLSCRRSNHSSSASMSMSWMVRRLSLPGPGFPASMRRRYRFSSKLHGRRDDLTIGWRRWAWLRRSGLARTRRFRAAASTEFCERLRVESPSGTAVCARSDRCVRRTAPPSPRPIWPSRPVWRPQLVLPRLSRDRKRTEVRRFAHAATFADLRKRVDT